MRGILADRPRRRPTRAAGPAAVDRPGASARPAGRGGRRGSGGRGSPASERAARCRRGAAVHSAGPKSRPRSAWWTSTSRQRRNGRSAQAEQLAGGIAPEPLAAYGLGGRVPGELQAANASATSATCSAAGRPAPASISAARPAAPPARTRSADLAVRRALQHPDVGVGVAGEVGDDVADRPARQEARGGRSSAAARLEVHPGQAGRAGGRVASWRSAARNAAGGLERRGQEMLGVAHGRRSITTLTTARRPSWDSGRPGAACARSAASR